ncbi:SLAM family member 5-like [Aptenodytes patagonicus]|uniref:SLAM family member 5-like n=1 Tax=Aptenodytes patagonicus TaxID=9234 RepID=UPI003F9F063D
MSVRWYQPLDEAQSYLHPSSCGRKTVGVGTCVFLLPPQSVVDAGCREPLSVRRGSMDVFRCLLLTALLLHHTTCAGDGAELTSAVGRSVTFLLQNLDEEAAAWSFHNDVIVTVKFGNPPEVTFFDDNYKLRLAFPRNGNALTISQLRMDDAGTYTAKTSGVKTTFILHVYRELEVPTVTCAAQNCSADGCRYTLRCTASGSGYGNVSYSWSVGDWPRSEGPTVLVEESPLDESLPLLTCTVRNPVSSRNTTVVSPAALCAENTTHPPTTGTYSSRQAGIVAALVTGVGVLLAVVIFVIYCKSKGWRIFCLPAAEATNTEAGAEYATVYAQVGPSQQVHLQSFSNAQRDDPQKTLTPGVETSKTIYFTIQAMAQTDDEKMGNGMPAGSRMRKTSTPVYP